MFSQNAIFKKNEQLPTQYVKYFLFLKTGFPKSEVGEMVQAKGVVDFLPKLRQTSFSGNS